MRVGILIIPTFEELMGYPFYNEQMDTFKDGKWPLVLLFETDFVSVYPLLTFDYDYWQALVSIGEDQIKHKMGNK